VYIRCGERGCGGRRGEGKGMVGACAGRDAPPRAGDGEVVCFAKGAHGFVFSFFYNEERKGWAKGTRKALVNVGLGRTKAEKPKGPRKHTARVNARYMTTRVRASLSSYRLHHTGSLHTQLEASLHSALLRRRHHHLRAAAAAGGNLPLGPCRSPPACCHLISAQVTRISLVSYHV
jgi:hypothetical protein